MGSENRLLSQGAFTGSFNPDAQQKKELNVVSLLSFRGHSTKISNSCFNCSNLAKAPQSVYSHRVLPRYSSAKSGFSLSESCRPQCSFIIIASKCIRFAICQFFVSVNLQKTEVDGMRIRTADAIQFPNFLHDGTSELWSVPCFAFSARESKPQVLGR